ncbi:MCE family protein [Rhodococcus chondri]|uniref:MCE family protein n=1 Tax=Rhodococcus chondri TaxID=3065941 RepID=A0ABU7JYR0_9NOCA|nr:MCE family protein [Rhodococcus sp. CC-R104]MEE2035141.1 MCE family protein [Rhodococcus sp. CC-R104]
MGTLACVVVVAGGCGFRGLNSLDLPGTRGHGDGAYEVTVEMPDVTTLDRNSRVRVADVTVGRVSGLHLADGHARVSVMLDAGTVLPANATAKIGQSSLLGSAHVELAAPVDEPAQGRLGDGDLIPLARAGAFPTTEQTLSSLALVLSGGGLAQAQVISRELNSALGGRQESVRSLITRLDAVLTGLDGQKQQIIGAMESLDALTVEVAAHNEQLAAATDQLAPTLDVLAAQEENLTRAADTLGQFGRVATEVVQSSGDDLTANLRDLEPVLASLAAAGDSLTESLRYLLTFPFPIDTYRNAVRGDYANGTVVLDLTLPTLENALLLGTPFEGALTGTGRPIPDLVSLLVPPLPTPPTAEVPR